MKNSAEYAGKLHNLILDSSGKMYLQSDRTLISYERELYKITRIGKFEISSKSVHLKLQPSSIDNVSDYVNSLTLLSSKQKEYFIKICNSVKQSASLNELEDKINKLLHQLANDQTMEGKSKMTIAFSAGVAKYSYIYWANAKVNKNNPYYIIKREQNADNYYPIFSCSELVDIGAMGQAYNYYLSGGYTPAQAQTAAIQDGAYNSGLANLPGGSCGL